MAVPRPNFQCKIGGDQAWGFCKFGGCSISGKVWWLLVSEITILIDPDKVRQIELIGLESTALGIYGRYTVAGIQASIFEGESVSISKRSSIGVEALGKKSSVLVSALSVSLVFPSFLLDHLNTC